ncbi:uncharacterized protein isoform X2 [Musca autumnalis]|uniref:uncharacterized protein isoform X2 n=1 Tax=Musca autumnalis TaxID=221902 RepID=UPI003CE67835
MHFCSYKKATALLLIIFRILQMSFAGTQTWTYELLNVTLTSSNLDVLDGDLKVIRISRGSFAISGHFDIKQDIDDSSLVEGVILRRTSATDEYRPFPFDITNQTFSEAMNKYYKPLVMDSVAECTTNAPVFDEFESPLSKRYVKVDKCQLSTDNMPSHMPEGFYKILIKLHGATEACIETIFEIENTMF